MLVMDGLSVITQATVCSEPNLDWKVLGPWEYGKNTGVLQ